MNIGNRTEDISDGKKMGDRSDGGDERKRKVENRSEEEEYSI